jgi:hypothetical protein
MDIKTASAIELIELITHQPNPPKRIMKQIKARSAQLQAETYRLHRLIIAVEDAS